MSAPSTALNNLRAFVIVIVLAFHSVLAYLAFLPAAALPFDSPPYQWRSFPIIDNERWFGFDLFCAWQDVYLITLMFFLSGLFVWPSLVRKGSEVFVRDRLLRLALPYALVVMFLMPLAHYPVYRVTAADPSVADFWRHWLALPFWPNGPPWFLTVLLVLDLAAAALFTFARHWGDALARLSARPTALMFALVTASAVAYVPPALAFTPWEWLNFGPFAIQFSRPLHYAVYFFAGVGIGACGIDRGLLAPDGWLVRRWATLLAAAAALFVLWLCLTALTMDGGGAAPLWLQFLDALSFVLACGSSCLFVLAVFLRFAATRRRAFDVLKDNAYGLYLIHYVFVVWLQYVLLGLPIFAVIKATIVFGGTLLLSWGTVAALRCIPAAARVISTERRVVPKTY